MAERDINWTRKALYDRTGIIEYWYNRIGTADYSVKLEKLFASTLRLVTVLPRIGRVFDETRNIRYVVVKDYKIYYTFTDLDVTVLAIWDTRRDQKNLDV